MRDLRRALLVPAFLTVTALDPACSDDKPPSTETGTTTSTTTPTSSGATGTTSVEPFTDCGVYPDMAACEPVSDCLWDEFAGACLPNCPLIKDQATCDMTDFCEWFDGCQQPV